MKRVLVIDIGGSSLKLLASGRKKPVRIPSGEHLTPRAMVAAVRQATSAWTYDVVSIGYPGVVRRGRPQEDAPHLGRGWTRFNFQRAFGRPVRIINDAAMQALGSYRGGRMLFLGLGTGLGSTLILDGVVQPMELGDLPYRANRPYADYLGKDGRRRMGRRRWLQHTLQAVRQLQSALLVPYVVLGGGGAKFIHKPPPAVRLGGNSKAFLGGFRLWDKRFRDGL